MTLRILSPVVKTTGYTTQPLSGFFNTKLFAKIPGTQGRCFFVDNNQATRHTHLTPDLIPFHIHIAFK